MAHDHHSHHPGGAVDAPEMKHQIAEEWKEYWQSQGRIPAWDYTSEIVLEVIRRSMPSMRGAHVLEAGCGTGRISLELSRSGAQVACIDISPEAVAHTKNVFSRAGASAEVSEGSLFDMPFNTGQFDIVWNAGVLEHFSEPERIEALRELLRVTKPGGLVVTLNPYKFAVLYRLGKMLAERFGRWPYGHEDPIASLTPASGSLDCTADREYTTGFILVCVESLRAIRMLQPIVERLRTFCVSAHQGRWGGVMRGMDRFFSRLFGGYLLVSVFRKADGDGRQPQAQRADEPAMPENVSAIG